jgi:hypothetical protein
LFVPSIQIGQTDPNLTC